MNVSPETLQTLGALVQAAAKQCPAPDAQPVFTDIYFHVDTATGEVVMTDDDDHVLARTTVAEWRGKSEEALLDDVQPVLRLVLETQRAVVEHLNLVKPYAFVLADDEGETLTDIFLVDDERVLVPGELMAGLEEDLDAFLDRLMED